MVELVVIVALVILVAGVALGVEFLRADDFGVVRRLSRRVRRPADPRARAPGLSRSGPAWHEVGSTTRSGPLSIAEALEADPREQDRSLRRRLLWRDSAIVLFAICAVVLIVGTMLPDASAGPEPSGRPSPSEVAGGSGGVDGATGTPDPTTASPAPSSPDASGTPAASAAATDPVTAAPSTPAPTDTPTTRPAPTPTPVRPTPPPAVTPVPPTPTPTPTAAPATPTPTPGPDAPVAVITQSTDCISIAGFVRFDGRDSLRTKTYHWDFGDGFTSDRPAPIHAYALLPNVYTVTLTVTGPGGEASTTSTVTVPCP